MSILWTLCTTAVPFQFGTMSNLARFGIWYPISKSQLEIYFCDTTLWGWRQLSGTILNMLSPILKSWDGFNISPAEFLRIRTSCSKKITTSRRNGQNLQCGDDSETIGKRISNTCFAYSQKDGKEKSNKIMINRRKMQATWKNLRWILLYSHFRRLYQIWREEVAEDTLKFNRPHFLWGFLTHWKAME